MLQFHLKDIDMCAKLLTKQKLKAFPFVWKNEQLLDCLVKKFSSLCQDGDAEPSTNRFIYANFLLDQQRSRFYCGKKQKQKLDFHHSLTGDNFPPKVQFSSEEGDGQAYFDLKNTLHTETDEIMCILNSCKNLDELKEAVSKTCNEFTKDHIVRCVILTWMHQAERQNIISSDSHAKLLDHLTTLLATHVSELGIGEISCCLLYLRKMGMPATNPVVQNLLLHALNVINNSNETVELPALSRLIVAINTGHDFFTPLLCAKFSKHISEHIGQFQTEEEARLLAICMRNLSPLIDSDMLNAYKERISTFIQTGVISFHTPRTILKLLNTLNMATWSQENAHLIRDLMVCLKPCIHQLEGNDLTDVCRIYHHHKEPTTLHEPLHEAIKSLYTSNRNPETLACLVPFTDPSQRESLVKDYRHLIASAECWQHMNASTNFFTALRALKMTDIRTCNAYWDGVLNKIDGTPEEEFNNLRFLQHCHRYMNFNNNLGGTFRHQAIEKRLCQEATRIIEYEIEGRLPHTFARLASFVLAYGHTPYSWKKYPNILLSKIITMADQFTPSDCFQISRGLYISLQMRYRYEVPPLVRMQLATIDTVLSGCAEKYLASNEKQTCLNDLNLILKTLSQRKSLKNSTAYHKIMHKCNNIKCADVNSRFIRDMSYNLTTANYILPQVLDEMFKYVEENHNHVGGETLEKLLTCAYNLGYMPKGSDALQYAALILLRDFNHMSSLALVQAGLSLGFYKALPEELINKFFCVKFIQRVENEIQMCYSKATYPERVLNLVMQLNRSVCLDYPECRVPWFQQNFIEAQVSKKSTYGDYFSRDVKKFLTIVLQDESHLLCNHTTPYGYQIDFVIHFDENKQLLKASPVEATMLDRITKVAILLLKLDSFCENDLETLRGPQLLKMKHLEMMGYKVLHINEHDWNSKYMKVPRAKTNYLRCLLQITH